MRHASQTYTGAALLGMLLAACSVGANAQTVLQQALLRSVPAAVSQGDSAAPTPATTVAAALRGLATEAAVIFTGSVATVRPDAEGGARVTFLVEHGVRGVASGSRHSMRVSSWGGGAERYFPGERALFLLTAPSVSGFSAPVMGDRGVVPLTGDALVGTLDLRWVAADVQRGAAFTVRNGQPGASMRAEAFAASSSTATPAASSALANSLSLPDVHAIDRDLVLDLLRTPPAGPGQTRS